MSTAAARKQTHPSAHWSPFWNLWSSILSPGEAAAVEQLGDFVRASSLRAHHTIGSRGVLLSPGWHELDAATGEAVEFAAQRDRDVLVRTPAIMHGSYVRPLLQHHDAMCLWWDEQGERLPSAFFYLGPRAWDFSRAFSAHGAVFLRGQGHVGPWTVRGG